MVLSQAPHQVLLRNVRVTLRRCNRGVTKKSLHHADGHAGAQQQRGHGMPQHMGADMPVYACLTAYLRNDVGDALRGKSPASRIEEQCRTPYCNSSPGLAM